MFLPMSGGRAGTMQCWQGQNQCQRPGRLQGAWNLAPSRLQSSWQGGQSGKAGRKIRHPTQHLIITRICQVWGSYPYQSISKLLFNLSRDEEGSMLQELFVSAESTTLEIRSFLSMLWSLPWVVFLATPNPGAPESRIETKAGNSA